MYSDTLTAANGCDSIVTLNLTIHNVASSDTTATACDSLVWRGVTYTSTGTYSETLQTINGCDSIVTLNLTITPSPTLDLGNDTTSICQGDSVLLDAGSGHTNYLWSTGETTQTIYASTSGSYSVTVGNGTPVSNSNSLLFDPNWLNPVGEIPDNSNLNTIGDKITIMAWVKTLGDINGESSRIVDRSEANAGGTDRWLFCNTPTNNRMQFSVGTNQGGATEDVTGTTNINIGEWQFVTAVFDAGNVKLYLNGILDGSGIMNTTSLSHVQNVPIYLGSVNGNNSFWNGHLDDISIWNTSLTQSEIQTYMSCPPTGNEAGLIGYWNFNEGTGGSITDQSINNNNGTIVNAYWTSQTPLNIVIIVQLQIVFM